MDENQVEIIENEEEKYHPRPAWQVWMARIGVGIVLLGFGLYCWHLASGGMG